MASEREIKKLLLDKASAFKKQPSEAQYTDKASLRLDDGFRCTFNQDDTSFVIDLPPELGGAGAGPTPGYFGRAAIMSCVAIGIKTTAIRHGISICSIDIRLEMDWDDRGAFGVDGISAASQDLRLGIEVASTCPESKIADVVAEALAHDPWFLNYVEAQKASTDLTCIQMDSKTHAWQCRYPGRGTNRKLSVAHRMPDVECGAVRAPAADDGWGLNGAVATGNVR